MKILKFGGSLMSCAERIMPLFKGYEVLLVPGGGEFAKHIKGLQEEHGFSDTTAHLMAVLATHQYGYFLSGLSGIPLIHSPGENTGQAIILPLSMLSNSNLEASWDVASDTIACYIAKCAGGREFTKLTDVDGVFLEGKVQNRISAGKLLNTTTCLDKSLPAYLQRWKMSCRVVNGKKADNIRKVFEEETIGTLVTGGK